VGPEETLILIGESLNVETLSVINFLTASSWRCEISWSGSGQLKIWRAGDWRNAYLGRKGRNNLTDLSYCRSCQRTSLLGCFYKCDRLLRRNTISQSKLRSRKVVLSTNRNLRQPAEPARFQTSNGRYFLFHF
jgi:hypothetical protein